MQRSVGGPFVAAGLVGAVSGSSGFTTFLVVAAIGVLLLPGLAVTVRRLHGTAHSGWWYLIALLPFGGLVLLVFTLTQGTPGSNSYGARP